MRTDNWERVGQVFAGALAARAATANWTKFDTVACCVVACWLGTLELIKRRSGAPLPPEPRDE